MSKQDNKKPNQMVILILSSQSVSLLMKIHQLLVVQITLSVYGMQRQDKKLNPLIKTTKIFLHNLKYHFRIAHYYQMFRHIVQYLVFVRIFNQKHQVHLYCKENLQTIRGKI
ncbi:unnamed protein product [Paramecium primaurelia]|uniref:Uncharacterized protein n=1 Tax=Paramecium primaurelia TaxID=5886 RepID=A0A8S1KE43_PARPR|nr:unnamed protein product [Paramecium primaurelia]